jgi:hypothetical protein
MKKLLVFSFAIITIASFAACTRGARTTSAHYISATAGSISSFYSSGSAVTTDGAAGAKIVIEGTAPSGAKMLVILNPYAATTGTLALSNTGNTNCEYISPASDTINMSVHGTVTLTSVTPDIIGTFTYTGSDSSVFTGSFNVPMP